VIPRGRPPSRRPRGPSPLWAAPWAVAAVMARQTLLMARWVAQARATARPKDVMQSPSVPPRPLPSETSSHVRLSPLPDTAETAASRPWILVQQLPLMAQPWAMRAGDQLARPRQEAHLGGCFCGRFCLRPHPAPCVLLTPGLGGILRERMPGPARRSLVASELHACWGAH